MTESKDDLIREVINDLERAIRVCAIKTSPPGTAEMMRAANGLIEGAPSKLERALTHPEAQGNKDLGEPQTSFAWQKIETAPKDGTNILGSVFGVERSTGEIFWWEGAWRTWDGENHTRTIHFPTHWAPLPPPPSERSEAAPTSLQPIKGESDLEKAGCGGIK